jgi:hypothetical protein
MRIISVAKKQIEIIIIIIQSATMRNSEIRKDRQRFEYTYVIQYNTGYCVFDASETSKS